MTSTRALRALAITIVAAISAVGLAACSPLDAFQQAAAERILNGAIGDAGGASVHYEHRIAAGLTCSGSGQLDTADAEVVTAIAAALARIDTENVLPGCNLDFRIRFADSEMRMSIESQTAARIDSAQWAPIFAFAVDADASDVSAFGTWVANGVDDVDELLYLVDTPETVDLADVVATADPLLRADAPAAGFNTVTLLVRGCGPTYWGPMADGTERAPTYGAEIELEGSGYGSSITKCIGSNPTIRVPLPLPDDARAAIDAVVGTAAASLGPLDAVTGDLQVSAPNEQNAAAPSMLVADLAIFVRADSTVSNPPLNPGVLAAAESIRDAIAATGVDFSLTVRDFERVVLEANAP